ncbi:MAG: esterase-like activity of phytase family protein, partial [Pseudomonadota bacterium]
ASGGDYRPVDAVALPNRHQILLLERAFSVFGGFRSRLSLIDVAPEVLCGSNQGATDQAPLPSRVLATLNDLIPAENYEGLALRESERGLYIFLISDDNQNFIQRTLLIQLRWRAED